MRAQLTLKPLVWGATLALLFALPAQASISIEAALKEQGLSYETKENMFVVGIDLGLGKTQTVLLYESQVGQDIDIGHIVIPIGAFPEGSSPGLGFLKAINLLQEELVIGRVEVWSNGAVVIHTTFILNGCSSETVAHQIFGSLAGARGAEPTVSAALEEE